MSTSGILREDNVIFYHPFDSFTEYTQSQVWAGLGSGSYIDHNIQLASGSFVDAQIVSGITPTMRTQIEWSNDLTTFLGSDGIGGTDCNVLKLNENKIAVVYRDTSTSGFCFVKVGTISGTTITYGSAYPVLTTFSVSQIDACALTEDKIVITMNRFIFDTRDAVVGSISGTTVTFGSIVSFDPVLNGTDQFDMFRMARIDDTRFIVTYREFVTPDNIGRSVIGSVSGTTITFGSTDTFRATNGITASDVCSINDGEYVITAYKNLNPNGQGVAHLGVVSGTNVNWDTSNGGSGTVFYTQTDVGYIGGVVPVGIDRAVVWVLRGVSLKFFILKRSGTTLTFSNQQFMSSIPITTNVDFAARIAPVDDDHFVFTWADGHDGGVGKSTIGKLRDDQNIVFAPSGEFSQGSEVDVADIAYLGNNRYVVAYKDIDDTNKGKTYIGSTIDILTTKSSGTDIYPSISGYDRVVVGGWTNTPCSGSSQIKISRGYDIHLTSGYIGLGSGAWSGSNVTTFLNELNDGLDHLFVIDFENTTGNDWDLSTSIDGSPFVVHGTQTSGNQPLVTIDTLPEFSGTSPSASGNTWVDELVFWAGDKNTFTKFTDAELEKLFRLADENNLSMPNYSGLANVSTDNIHLFIMSSSGITDDIDLFTSSFGMSVDDLDFYTYGVLGSINDNINLFISGVPASGVDGDDIIDTLIRSSDFNPNVIGLFSTAVSGVTIEVWDVVSGVNNPVSLISDVCTEIGDTGRWFWSTSNFPPLINFFNQYVFKMTANNAETFVGEFILKSSTSRSVDHPGWHNKNKFVQGP
jgi:hypothetical protein